MLVLLFLQQGKVKNIGVSNYNVKHIKEIEATQLEMPVANQIEIHPYHMVPDGLEAYMNNHNILPIVSYASQKFICDVVGPICETADFMGKDKELYVKTGDYVAIEDVGAYGFSLASNYNVRPRPDEYIINSDTKSIKKIREREDYNDMVKSELKFLKT